MKSSRDPDMLTAATLRICQASGIAKQGDLATMCLIHMVCTMVNTVGGERAMLQLFQLRKIEDLSSYLHAARYAARGIENYSPNDKSEDVLNDLQTVLTTTAYRNREAIFRILLVLCIAMVQCLLKSFTDRSTPVADARWTLALNFWDALQNAHQMVSEATLEQRIQGLLSQTSHRTP